MNNFVRVAAVTPKIRVADCVYNANAIIDAINKANEQNIRLICMPELCITGYTCGDLFLQSSLLEGAETALYKIVEETKHCHVVAIVGLPMDFGKLYNCAAVFSRGKILGIVPKSTIPDYGEFCESRYFSAWDGTITYRNGIPFGANMLFGFAFAVEIGEDLWATNPPSVRHATAGATIIANPSASCASVGKAEKRRALVSGQSGRLLSGYVHADAGMGESTTDLVFSAHNLICENGNVIAESAPFGDGFVMSEIDLAALAYERRRMTTFKKDDSDYVHVPFVLDTDTDVLTRKFSPTPFIPEKNIAERCEEILNIQSQGLKKRLEHIGAKSIIGISGGLDSTLALLVAARASNKNGITAITMPCFGTTTRTKTNAHKLCEALSISCREIDITEQTRQHLHDISHPREQHDTTYENAQARIRTLVLMNIANQENGIVIGTGSLSELALGWATYNGDHMSMYAVNAGVPKTMVRNIVKHILQTTENAALQDVLADILDTPVSPELLPPKQDEITQKTEEVVGPYELHDFFIYHTLRWGRTSEQVLGLAKIVFKGIYTHDEIKKWQAVFYRRFLSQQFKRNCLPDSPKVGSISLSPRGNWRMPSDASNYL
ncbi:MAG: NAD(+) synthase [Defluviitaleaceae bacterium]|nr:NAD(+) synthase [Defluviitaleaceae bacterium]